MKGVLEGSEDDMSALFGSIGGPFTLRMNNQKGEMSLNIGDTVRSHCVGSVNGIQLWDSRSWLHFGS